MLDEPPIVKIRGFADFISDPITIQQLERSHYRTHEPVIHDISGPKNLISRGLPIHFD